MIGSFKGEAKERAMKFLTLFASFSKGEERGIEEKILLCLRVWMVRKEN